MGMIEKLKKSMDEGRESTKQATKDLTEQNQVIIDNMNEMIDLMKKICDKLGVDTDVEEAD